ncbi:MAG: hypothetical protein INQ03_00795 [Candidatus Heimdallarchaeota archaeon]|nr:hypothetical protein [Candidatus Heimdallarchaeota archaeon]
MYRNKEEIDLAIENYLKNLQRVALKDDIITLDEERIISWAIDAFKNMQLQLYEVLESGLNDTEFYELLKDMQHDIIENALRIANEDDVITDDERALIDELHRALHQEDG